MYVDLIVCWEKCGKGRHTLIQRSLQLLPNSHKLYPGPEVWADILAYAECPAAAQEVAPVLPYGLEALLEQVDGLAHLDLVDGSVIVVAPEVLYRLDQDVELLEGRLVILAIVGLLFFLLPVGGGEIDLSAMAVRRKLEGRSIWRGKRGHTGRSRRSTHAG